MAEPEFSLICGHNAKTGRANNELKAADSTGPMSRPARSCNPANDATRTQRYCEIEGSFFILNQKGNSGA